MADDKKVKAPILEEGQSNVSVKLEGDILTIKVPINYKGTISKSGNSHVIATLGAPRNIPGTDLTLGLNLFRKKVKGGEGESGMMVI